MPLAKALALCPGLILLPVDIPYYSQVSDKVMSVLEEFADSFERASIDEAYLDCTSKIGSESPESYASAMKRAVAERCSLMCSVGIAPTKSAAKIASDFKKPDGLTIIYPDKLEEFLAPLEVSRVAGIGPKTEQALKEMGINTLGQLATSDVQNLVEQFGKNGQWMWSVANGTDSEPVVPRGEHVSISTEYTLDEFTKDKKKISVLLSELVPDMYQRAKKYGYEFRTVGIKLVRTDFTLETRETTFPEPQDAPESISSVLGPLLDKFSFGSDNGDADNSVLRVRKIGIRLSHLSSNQQTRQDQPDTKPIQKSIIDYT
jgi:DNA polymerase IV (DinB-like DNA polymerase)